MKEITTRILSGIVFVAIVIGCILWNEWSLAVLFLILSTIGTIEFFKIYKKKNQSINYKLGPAVNVFFYTLITLPIIGIIEPKFLFLALPVIVILIMMELFSKKNVPFQNIGNTLFAIFYITVPFTALNYLNYNTEIYEKINLTSDWKLLIGFFIILWTSDSMALVVGKLIGKNKLFVRISPRKTWEGFIGGVVFAILAGYLFAYFTGSSSFHWIIMALIISVFGMLGDLSESLLKRSGKVKDSGTIMPGHGGVLDRFDGIFLSAPLILAYLLFI